MIVRSFFPKNEISGFIGNPKNRDWKMQVISRGFGDFEHLVRAKC